MHRMDRIGLRTGSKIPTPLEFWNLVRRSRSERHVRSGILKSCSGAISMTVTCFPRVRGNKASRFHRIQSLAALTGVHSVAFCSVALATGRRTVMQPAYAARARPRKRRVSAVGDRHNWRRPARDGCPSGVRYQARRCLPPIGCRGAGQSHWRCRTPSPVGGCAFQTLRG